MTNEWRLKTIVGAIHIPPWRSSPSEWDKESTCTFAGGALELQIEGGEYIIIWDAGQGYDETRWISVLEDDVTGLVGQRITDVRLLRTTRVPVADDGREVEDAFVRIETEEDSLTFSTHSSHDGYVEGIELHLAHVKADGVWPRIDEWEELEETYNER